MPELDERTYQLLEKLYQVQRLEESDLFRFTGHTDTSRIEPHSHLLLQKRMIKVYETGGTPDGEGGHVGAKRFYEIDLPGKAYVEGRTALANDKRVEKRRYAITTSIAVVALILSLAALLWQAYTWTYELHHGNAVSSVSYLPGETPSAEGQQGLPAEP